MPQPFQAVYERGREQGRTHLDVALSRTSVLILTPGPEEDASVPEQQGYQHQEDDCVAL